MQQPLWLIRSKQRAFNPIHVFFLRREQPVKHNQIPHAKQRGGRRRPHLLSGVASRKLAENSWLCRWRRRENLGKSHSLSPAQHREGAVWSLQAEKHILRPPDLVQPLDSEMAHKEKAHIFTKSLLCDRHLPCVVSITQSSEIEVGFPFFPSEKNEDLTGKAMYLRPHS